MYNFRIINIPGGDQVIDRKLKTPQNALTPLQVVEYEEMDAQLYIADRMKKKLEREEEYKRKLARNPLWKIACFCGLV